MRAAVLASDSALDLGGNILNVVEHMACDWYWSGIRRSASSTYQFCGIFPAAERFGCSSDPLYSFNIVSNIPFAHQPHVYITHELDRARYPLRTLLMIIDYSPPTKPCSTHATSPSSHSGYPNPHTAPRSSSNRCSETPSAASPGPDLLSSSARATGSSAYTPAAPNALAPAAVPRLCLAFAEVDALAAHLGARCIVDEERRPAAGCTARSELSRTAVAAGYTADLGSGRSLAGLARCRRSIVDLTLLCDRGEMWLRATAYIVYSWGVPELMYVDRGLRGTAAWMTAEVGCCGL